MDYNSISIKPYIKSHLELQREKTLIELAPSHYLFAYMNMFARFDENPAITLQEINETKRHGRTHGWADARTRTWATYTQHKQSLRGGIQVHFYHYKPNKVSPLC